MTRDAALAHLETYLTQVRRHLRGVSGVEAQEVLDELRAHVLDRVEGQLTPGAVEAALSALGPPREVARLNATERVAASMEQNRSVLGVIRAVGRLASLSVMGFVTFMVSIFGYGLAAGFLVSGVWKVFDPGRVGLWHVQDPVDPWSYSLGVIDNPEGKVELLGWWMVPMGLTLGVALGYLTWRFGVAMVRIMAAGSRRRRVHDQG